MTYGIVKWFNCIFIVMSEWPKFLFSASGLFFFSYISHHILIFFFIITSSKWFYLRRFVKPLIKADLLLIEFMAVICHNCHYQNIRKLVGWAMLLKNCLFLILVWFTGFSKHSSFSFPWACFLIGIVAISHVTTIRSWSNSQACIRHASGQVWCNYCCRCIPPHL